MQSIVPEASKDERPGCGRAVALRGPLKKRPPQGDGERLARGSARLPASYRHEIPASIVVQKPQCSGEAVCAAWAS